MFRLICIVIGVVLLTGCGSGQKKGVGQNPERNFKLAEIPVTLLDPGERTAYIAGHYWDHFDFKDTAYIHLPEVTEQAFVGFLELLKYVPLPLAGNSIKKMLGKAEADSTVFHYFQGLYEKYLYDPNSPVRNEEFYISVLESVIQSPTVSDINKVRPGYQLKMALKNRQGTPAVDFVYTLASGKSGRLSELKAEWLLLYIQNPDCDACRETRAALINSSVISELVRKE